jgi:hypothetical protein
MDSLRHEVLVEMTKAWFQTYPAEARAFAKQLKYDWDHQEPGGRWGLTKAGYKKYSLPQSLVWTAGAISQELRARGYDIDPLLLQDDDDVRVLAQEFPDFMCRMNIDKRTRRRGKNLIVP